MKNPFNEYIDQSVKLDKQFKRRWDINTRMVNLSEEVGELAHDVLVAEKSKNDKPHAPLADNLTNLLYELFLIADYYKVDLDKSWGEFIKNMPGWAKMRNKK